MVQLCAMRTILMLFFGACLLSACGGGPCAGPETGTWKNSSGNSLELDASCAFHFSASNCQSSGTYAAPLGTSGTVQVSIQSTSGGACFPLGNYACAYVVTGNALALNCGSGNDLYSR